MEQTIALLHWFGRLRIRWETRDDIHDRCIELGQLGRLRTRIADELGIDPHATGT